MSLNIGTDGVNAANNLGNAGDFVALLDALLKVADDAVHNAIEMSPGPDRDDRLGYARALRDLWIALQSARTGVPYRRVDKPSIAGSAANLPKSRVG